MFKFPEDEDLKRIADLQVTNKESDSYLKISKSEFEKFKNYLPNEIGKVLDLGCGLGRASVYLNHQLDYKPFFVLADFNEVSDEIKYGWNPQGSIYNSLDKTSDFVTLNGLSRFKTLNLKKERISKLKDIDVAMSLLSVGFHYPVEPYLDSFHKILKDSGVLILGVRSKKYGGQYDQDSFGKLFEVVSFPKEYVELTKEQIIVLKKIRS